MNKQLIFSYWGGMTPFQIKNIEWLLENLGKDVTDINHCAYIMATIHHETKDSFAPIKEATKHSEAVQGIIIHDDVVVRRLTDALKRGILTWDYWSNGGWFGRGLVQVTLEENYKRLGLTKETALQMENSYVAAVNGMTNGLFTGKKLADYINDSKVDFINARRVINGSDCADQIAENAIKWASCLTK